MTNELYDRILALLPSADLREAIRRTGYRVPDGDLLTIAWRFAPDYDARIALLRELGEGLEGEYKAYVSRILDTQREMLEGFSRQEEGTVYELFVKETPDACDEGNLCRSYEEALRMIPLIYREYPFCKEGEETRYRVVKRRILSDETGFLEDEIGEARLLPRKKLYDVELYALDHRPEGCKGGCLSCEFPCVSCHEVLFPTFVRHGEAVRYKRDPFSGGQVFGIVFDLGETPCADCYVIPLESLPVCYHDFENIHNAHQHIPAPLVERIEPSALPEKLRADYEACLAYILEHWPRKE